MSLALRSSTSVWSTSGGLGRTGLFAGPVRIGRKPEVRLKARGALHASVVADGRSRLFVADMAGWVQAFSQEGAPLWQQQLPGGISASPTVDVQGNRLFIGTVAGWVYALHTEDGDVLWRRKLPSQTDPRILSDLLYLPTQQFVVLSSWGERFHFLNASAGDTVRTLAAGLWPRTATTADAQGNVYGLRALRGKGVAFFTVSAEGMETTLFTHPEGERGAPRMVTAAAPVLDEERGIVYFIVNGDHQAGLHAWSVQGSRLLWKTTMPSTVVATPAVGPTGSILVADMGGTLYALAPDGSVEFRYVSGAEYWLCGPVCAGNGYAFCGDPLGRLHRLNESGEGKEIFEAPRSIQARPAFDQLGNLYVSSTDRNVYVFRNLAED